MKRLSLFLFIYMFVGVSAWALDVEEFLATSIDVSQGEVTLNRHESILFGLSCKSGPVGKLTGLRTISIGDTIVHGKYSFQVGIIKVSKYNEDVKWGGKTIAKKGDIICVVAANEDALPSEKDCDALWLRITNCRPLKEKSEFPWLMTPYKHAHLTQEQRQIYLNAYFETMGFILYGNLDQKDVKAIKQLNAWIDCVMETKKSVNWSPNLSWVFGEDLDKSAAYVFYNKVSPLVCEGYAEKGGTEIRTLKIYDYGEWQKWSIKDKAVYLSGYIDTVASCQMRLRDAGMKNDVRDLKIVIEATGIDGILSDVLKIKFEPQYPLPWSISRGLGAARKRVFSD